MTTPGSPSAAPVGRREWVALGAILLVAGALRLGWPGLSQFRLDEAHISALALGIADGQEFPLWGTQSSVGVYLPPLADYVYALPLAIWKSPLSAVLLTGALNLAGVAVAWWTARRWWGRGAGLLAAGLLAANPWAVAYSRQIWQPDLMPPLAVAWLATGLAGFLEGRRGAVPAHLALLAAAANTHFTGALLLPVTLFLAVVGWRRLRWKEVAGGLALGALLSAPYLVYLWRDRAEIARIVGSATAEGAGSGGGVWGYWRMMLTGDGAHALLGAASAEWGAGWLLTEKVAAGAVLALLAGAALAWGWRMVRGPREGRAVAGLAVALWAALPLVALARPATPVHIHYLAMALPAGAMLAGSLPAALGAGTALGAGQALGAGTALGAGAARGARQRWPRLAAGAAGAGTALGAGAALAQAALSAALLAALGAGATPGGLGLPLGPQVRAAGAARALAGSAVLLVPGDNATSDEWAAVLGIHFWGTPHRLVDGRHAALFPAEDTALLVAPGAEEGLATYERFGAVAGVREVPGRAGEAPLRVGLLHGGVRPALRPAPAPALLANGVEILGYEADGAVAPGGTFTWWVGWRVAEERYDPARSYHITNQLLDARGERLAQADAGTLPTAAWAVGDLVVQAFTLSLPADAPPGPYTMRVGMYTFPEIEGQPLLDAAGLPLAEGVRLGPLGPLGAE